MRDDGFFEAPAIDHKSDAEEVLEGVLRKAQTEYEERKLVYFARFWANARIVKDFEAADLHHLMKLAKQLTYRHLTIISMLGRIVGANHTEIEITQCPCHSYATDKEFVESTASGIPHALIVEIDYLAGLRCIQFPRESNPNYYVCWPPHIIRGVHGVALDEFMELYRIRESDRVPLATLLRWPLGWRFGDRRMENHKPDPGMHRFRVRI